MEEFRDVPLREIEEKYLEAQKKYHPGYPLIKRGIFYGCRMVSSQYGIEFTGEDYSGIKKVYSIWICMNTPAQVADSIVSYHIVPKLLAGNPEKEEEKRNYDLIQVIQIRLGTGRAAKDKEEKGQANVSEDKSQELIQMLKVLFSETINTKEKKKILKECYGIRMNSSGRKEMEVMCNLADLVEERGIERGLERGLCAFIMDNLEEGVEPDRIMTKLVRRFELTPEQAQIYYHRFAQEEAAEKED